MSKIVSSITTGYISSRASGSDLSWGELDQFVNPQTMSSDEEGNVSHGANEKFRVHCGGSHEFNSKIIGA